MLSQGWRLFSRHYHAGVLNKHIEVMSKFFIYPEFMEAKNQFYIDYYNMGDVDSELLEKTLNILFSQQNASKTLNAFKNKDLLLKELLLADAKLRQQYLEDFPQPSATVNWKEFIAQQTHYNLDAYRVGCE